MTTLLNYDLQALRDRVFQFSCNHIGTRDDLHTLERMPSGLWQAMISSDIVGMSIPPDFQGHGGGWKELSATGEALVAGGGNLGIAVTWLLHSIVASFCLANFGTERQRKTYLGHLATGAAIACLAVSEPETGAHPKHMRTTAVNENGSYRLNGEKTYLTNGPIADLYVTIAVTAGEKTNKEFTAFLIPRDTPGLTITAPLAFPYLKPAAHGGIKLTDCVVPASAALGKTGRAYRDVVIPFRWIEDAMMAGAASGGMAYIVSHLASSVRLQGIKPDRPLQTAAGDLLSVSHTARVLALEVAAMLDARGAHDRHPEFDGLLWCGRQLTKRFLETVNDLVRRYEITLTNGLDQLLQDFMKLTSLAENVARIKQQRMGARLIGEQP